MPPNPAFLLPSERWEALIERNPNARDRFVYAVITTGIYCRPTCASRRPKRTNVVFFDNWQQAEAGGFRPCKRCSPQRPEPGNAAAEIVARSCAIIEASEREPSLVQLAEVVGLSPSYFQRLFKSVLGVTPKQYGMAQRASRARKNLQGGMTVTQAAYEAGYESIGQFYGMAAQSLGMPPSTYQKRGRGKYIRYAIAPCCLGWVLVATTDRGICKIDLDRAPNPLRDRLRADFSEAELCEDAVELQATVAKVLALLATPAAACDLPLDIQGTAFQQRVWAALRAIAPGTTASYAEIANNIGNPKASRAVARACGANRIAVVIPCHRVVRGDGSLGGYRWGTDRKQALLKKESAKAQKDEDLSNKR